MIAITAKYRGKCLTCGRWIEAGSKVMYEPGRGIRHPRACKAAEAAPAAAPAEYKRKQAEMTPEQRLAAIDEILARAGRTRATRDDGAGLVTEPLSFTRAGKEGPRVGEIIRHTRKGHTQPSAYVVISVSAPYYHSEDDCEDQGCFCGHYGWQVSYDAIRVAPTEAESAANAEAERKRIRKEEVARLLHASYGGENHIDSAPEGVTMTKLYGASRLAGSETWYLGSDGVVYYCRSDYDMGPSWWRTSATPELVREAEQLGVRP